MSRSERRSNLEAFVVQAILGYVTGGGRSWEAFFVHGGFWSRIGRGKQMVEINSFFVHGILG